MYVTYSEINQHGIVFYFDHIAGSFSTVVWYGSWATDYFCPWGNKLRDQQAHVVSLLLFHMIFILQVRDQMFHTLKNFLMYIA